MVTHDRTTTKPCEQYTITGVAPGATYDPTIELLFPDENDTPTVKRAAISPRATGKLPMVCFDCEVGK